MDDASFGSLRPGADFHRYSEPPGSRNLRVSELLNPLQTGGNSMPELKLLVRDENRIDLKAGFLQELKREVLATLSPEERAIIEVSTGDMGDKPDAVKLGWLKMRTKTAWTKQQYTRALNEVMKKLRTELNRKHRRKMISTSISPQPVSPIPSHDDARPFVSPSSTTPN